jgi:outer membrane protein OmpA-like peptidoglycan-associated protein
MRSAQAAHFVALLGFIMVVGPAPGQAEDMTREQMIQSLQGKTRGIEVPSANSDAPGKTASPANSAPTVGSSSHENLAEKLKNISTRKITVEERSQIASEVKQQALPTIDVEVFFAYDSAIILPEALPKLITLGQALSDPRLKGSFFLVGGHTDAKGGDEYNLGLSSRRADSVKQFLVRNFHLDPGALYPMGFGKEQLKNAADPFAGENRRVQIVNVQSAGVAQQ